MKMTSIGWQIRLFLEDYTVNDQPVQNNEISNKILFTVLQQKKT